MGTCGPRHGKSGSNHDGGSGAQRDPAARKRRGSHGGSTFRHRIGQGSHPCRKGRRRNGHAPQVGRTPNARTRRKPQEADGQRRKAGCIRERSRSWRARHRANRGRIIGWLRHGSRQVAAPHPAAALSATKAARASKWPPFWAKPEQALHNHCPPLGQAANDLPRRTVGRLFSHQLLSWRPREGGFPLPASNLPPDNDHSCTKCPQGPMGCPPTPPRDPFYGFGGSRAGRKMSESSVDYTITRRPWRADFPRTQ